MEAEPGWDVRGLQPRGQLHVGARTRRRRQSDGAGLCPAPSAPELPPTRELPNDDAGLVNAPAEQIGFERRRLGPTFLVWEELEAEVNIDRTKSAAEGRQASQTFSDVALAFLRVPTQATRACRKLQLRTSESWRGRCKDETQDQECSEPCSEGTGNKADAHDRYAVVRGGRCSRDSDVRSGRNRPRLRGQRAARGNDRVPTRPSGNRNVADKPVRRSSGRHGSTASHVEPLARLQTCVVARRELHRLHGRRLALARPPQWNGASAARLTLADHYASTDRGVGSGREGTCGRRRRFAASQTASIYVVPTDEGTPRRLPVDDARDLSWSPRGDEIAYDSPAGVIRAVRSDGSARPRVILPGTPGCYGPAWSADGLRVAAACGDSHGRYAYIDVVNADGRNRRRLIRHAYNEYGFAWSPGGRRILYGREDGQGIYAIGAEGVADRKITSDSPAQVGWGALTWSPDGRAIAYTTDRTGNGDLYVIGTDGRSKLRLTRSTASDIDPSWAPE